MAPIVEDVTVFLGVEIDALDSKYMFVHVLLKRHITYTCAPLEHEHWLSGSALYLEVLLVCALFSRLNHRLRESMITTHFFHVIFVLL